jgi:RimJ/RimL family protein N-acetyltransferase
MHQQAGTTKTIIKPSDEAESRRAMIHETLYERPINDDPVSASLAPAPSRSVFTGCMVRLEPIDPDAGHASEEARRSWDFLPWGPFPNEGAMHAQLRDFAAQPDRLFYAICDRATGEAVGKATYLDIQPTAKVIEIGGIWFAPQFARTRGATEALFLMLDHAMDDLGYRRMQWRCNALNEKSRAAARRLGYRFEGIWYNHMIVKGRNRDTAWYSILDTEWPAIRSTIQTWFDPTNFDADGRQRRSLSTMMTAAIARSSS